MATGPKRLLETPCQLAAGGAGSLKQAIKRPMSSMGILIRGLQGAAIRNGLRKAGVDSCAAALGVLPHPLEQASAGSSLLPAGAARKG